MKYFAISHCYWNLLSVLIYTYMIYTIVGLFCQKQPIFVSDSMDLFCCYLNPRIALLFKTYQNNARNMLLLCLIALVQLFETVLSSQCTFEYRTPVFEKSDGNFLAL